MGGYRSVDVPTIKQGVLGYFFLLAKRGQTGAAQYALGFRSSLHQQGLINFIKGAEGL